MPQKGAWVIQTYILRFAGAILSNLSSSIRALFSRKKDFDSHLSDLSSAISFIL